MSASFSGTGQNPSSLLRRLDYSVLQQCMHCGMCLPSCPTYEVTKHERSSPRGRIALMRAVADGKLEATQVFGEEMYFCLGCLACETACPAGVDYAHLFETARAEVERTGAFRAPVRSFWRGLLLRGLFLHPHRLRFVGRLLWIYQATGLQQFIRTLHLTAVLPAFWRQLEAQTPAAESRFSPELIPPREIPPQVRYRVALLTGCVQDVLFASINRDTADVLLANGCEVHTPPVQFCCGSLHAHNGDLAAAGALARRNLDTIDPDSFDAIITNAAGCGSHLKHYDRLLAGDALYEAKAVVWSQKLKDIHEWLVEIGFRPPSPSSEPAWVPQTVTYHEACHLCHGQGIARQPRTILQSIPGVRLVELAESTWCCGSAGIYNITQPEMAAGLQKRKMSHIAATGAEVVATANPGCLLQLQNGQSFLEKPCRVAHPVSLLAEAYRAENRA